MFKQTVDKQLDLNCQKLQTFQILVSQTLDGMPIEVVLLSLKMQVSQM
jgi:hypothetical protein